MPRWSIVVASILIVVPLPAFAQMATPPAVVVVPHASPPPPMSPSTAVMPPEIKMPTLAVPLVRPESANCSGSAIACPAQSSANDAPANRE
jgi:hypothetical protein